ncbi:MAG: S-layer homology domain-containing protein [Clostridia bacterium]|nr:S-layer homology domain-containing protein [Clostridia bacterium]
MRTRKLLVIFLIVAMTVCYMPITAFSDGMSGSTVIAYVDMPDEGYWSTSALQAAVNNGFLRGFSENGRTYISPDAPLTRAQMAAIVNRAFGSQNTAPLSGVSDVPAGKWYYSDMQKAVKMGTLKLDTNLRPNDNITRQEVFAILGRALNMNDGSMADLSKFTDASKVADWAVSSMGAMVKAGYIKGANNLLKPTSSMTRAECAQIMSNIINEYIAKPGTVTEVATGNVMVNVDGVTLKDVTITGDLIVGDGVGEGTVTLTNVIVKGNLIARGGGVGSIVITGGTIDGKVIIAKVDGYIRIFAGDGTEISFVEIADGKGDIIIEGKVGTLEVNSPDVKVVIASGANVGSVLVDAASTGSTIVVEGIVKNFETSAPNTTLSGTGAVSNATINVGANGTHITTPNTVITNGGATGATGLGGVEILANTTTINNSTGTSNIFTSPTPTGDESNMISIEGITLTGNAVVGSTLTARPRPTNATVNYQWMRSETADGTYNDIDGAISSTYTLVTVDADKYIKVVATGTDSYSGTVTSVATGAVMPAEELIPSYILLDMDEVYTIGSFSIKLSGFEKTTLVGSDNLRYKYIFDYENNSNDRISDYSMISVYDTGDFITNLGGMLREYPSDINITFDYYPNSKGQRFFQMVMHEELEYLQLYGTNIRWRIEH